MCSESRVATAMARIERREGVLKWIVVKTRSWNVVGCSTTRMIATRRIVAAVKTELVIGQWLRRMMKAEVCDARRPRTSLRREKDENIMLRIIRLGVGALSAWPGVA